MSSSSPLGEDYDSSSQNNNNDTLKSTHVTPTNNSNYNHDINRSNSSSKYPAIAAATAATAANLAASDSDEEEEDNKDNNTNSNSSISNKIFNTSSLNNDYDGMDLDVSSYSCQGVNNPVPIIIEDQIDSSEEYISSVNSPGEGGGEGEEEAAWVGVDQDEEVGGASSTSNRDNYNGKDNNNDKQDTNEGHGMNENDDDNEKDEEDDDNKDDDSNNHSTSSIGKDVKLASSRTKRLFYSPSPPPRHSPRSFTLSPPPLPPSLSPTTSSPPSPSTSSSRAIAFSKNSKINDDDSSDDEMLLNTSLMTRKSSRIRDAPRVNYAPPPLDPFQDAALLDSAKNASFASMDHLKRIGGGSGKKINLESSLGKRESLAQILAELDGYGGKVSDAGILGQPFKKPKKRLFSLEKLVAKPRMNDLSADRMEEIARNLDSDDEDEVRRGIV